MKWYTFGKYGYFKDLQYTGVFHRSVNDDNNQRVTKILQGPVLWLTGVDVFTRHRLISGDDPLCCFWTCLVCQSYHHYVGSESRNYDFNRYDSAANACMLTCMCTKKHKMYWHVEGNGEMKQTRKAMCGMPLYRSNGTRKTFARCLHPPAC